MKNHEVNLKITRRGTSERHVQKLEAINALCPGRRLLHHKGIESDETMFFHVTAGNVKFTVRR